MSNEVTIIEPNAHGVGHYLPFLERMVNVLATDYTIINVITTYPVENFNLDQIDGVTVKFSHTDSDNHLIYKIICKVCSYIKNEGISRILKYDYRHTAALKLARKMNCNKVLYLYTGYYMPNIVHKLLYKNLNIVYYRISHPYKKKPYPTGYKSYLFRFARQVRIYMFDNPNSKITVQTEDVKSEYVSDIGINPYLLRLPIAKDIDFHHRKNNYKINYLLFGLNHIGKDWQVVADAFNDMNEEEKNKIHLIFAGNFVDKPGANRPDELAFDNRIEVEIINEYISDDKKDQLFYMADYSILSFKKEFKMSSATLIDSLTYNCSVICSFSKEFEYVVNKYKAGYLFECSNKEDLTIALKKSIENYNRKSTIDHKQFKNDFSYEKTLSNLNKIWGD